MSTHRVSLISIGCHFYGALIFHSWLCVVCLHFVAELALATPTSHTHWSTGVKDYLIFSLFLFPLYYFFEVFLLQIDIFI